jgi:prevent-host-death family protein
MSAKPEISVSIGEMKKRLSELTNRVAFGSERVILTSRGRSKAVLVNLEDYERLKQLQTRTEGRAKALQAIRAHRQIIAARRGPIDVDIVEIIHEMREEQTDAAIEAIRAGD